VDLVEARRRFENEAVPGTCDTGRYRCSYYIWGEGPPLVFIHGIADDALSFIGPISLLSRYFRCVAYTLPTGSGDGARLSNYHHADYVADLFALLDHLGAEQAYLFGSSFGSTITLEAMHVQPRRFPRAILQGGFARRSLARAECLLARFARYWPAPMRRLPFRKKVLQHNHYLPFAARTPDVWECFLSCCGRPQMCTVARRALTVDEVDLRHLLPSINQPVMLICGDCDPVVNRTCEKELLCGLPAVARVELPNCGHLPYFTHPEALADVVHRFLTPPPCGV
jgi:pimeloyl-ACP methyl ester carboxylesterase